MRDANEFNPHVMMLHMSHAGNKAKHARKASVAPSVPNPITLWDFETAFIGALDE